MHFHVYYSSTAILCCVLPVNGETPPAHRYKQLPRNNRTSSANPSLQQHDNYSRMRPATNVADNRRVRNTQIMIPHNGLRLVRRAAAGGSRPLYYN